MADHDEDKPAATVDKYKKFRLRENLADQHREKLYEYDPTGNLFGAVYSRDRLVRCWHRLLDSRGFPPEFDFDLFADFTSIKSISKNRKVREELIGMLAPTPQDPKGSHEREIYTFIRDVEPPPAPKKSPDAPPAPPVPPFSSLEDEDDVLYEGESELFVFNESDSSWQCYKIPSMKDAKPPLLTFRFLTYPPSTVLRVRFPAGGPVVLDHLLDRRIALEEHQGDHTAPGSKTLAWTAFDFGDGKTLKERTFAMRFANKKLAKMFENQFKLGQMSAPV